MLLGEKVVLRVLGRWRWKLGIGRGGVDDLFGSALRGSPSPHSLATFPPRLPRTPKLCVFFGGEVSVDERQG